MARHAEREKGRGRPKKGERIDFQAHFLPQAYINRMKKRKTPPFIEQQGDVYRFQYGLSSAYFVRKPAYDIQMVLDRMDAAGITRQILSINIPGADVLDDRTGIEIAQEVNDEYAEIMARFPGRFSALATLPLRNTDASLREMERAAKKLGFAGALLFSNVEGEELSAPRLWPIYQLAQQLDLPLYIHPTRPVMADQVQKYGLEAMLGYVFDTSLAAMKLILSGVLEQYPNLKLVVPHGGGTLPYLAGRIDHQASLMPESMENLSMPPSVYLRKLYLDTVCISPETLRMAYNFIGADHLLFATDHPFVDMEQSVALVNTLDIPETDKQKIFSQNAMRLMRTTV